MTTTSPHPVADAGEQMRGLELARSFYEACHPQLWAAIPDIMRKAAVGLVGEGSECFGCDDALSQDHDFGPAFCLWLPRVELQGAHARVEAALAELPQRFMGRESRLAPSLRGGRVGPLAIEDFYAFFTGLGQPPSELAQWLGIPEYQLAACTNGEVFEDNAGIFTRWRQSLLPCYPEDVRLKKLAARCMHMAQAGQYNLPRCLMRGDSAAALLALARFAEAALSLAFLCNRRYMPFYKWSARLAAGLPVLGDQVARTLAELAALPLTREHMARITESVEALCSAVACHLRGCGLSDAPTDWLWAHGPEISRRIQAAELRSTDLLQG